MGSGAEPSPGPRGTGGGGGGQPGSSSGSGSASPREGGGLGSARPGPAGSGDKMAAACSSLLAQPPAPRRGGAGRAGAGLRRLLALSRPLPPCRGPCDSSRRPVSSAPRRARAGPGRGPREPALSPEQGARPGPAPPRLGHTGVPRRSVRPGANTTRPVDPETADRIAQRQKDTAGREGRHVPPEAGWHGTVGGWRTWTSDWRPPAGVAGCLGDWGPPADAAGGVGSQRWRAPSAMLFAGGALPSAGCPCACTRVRPLHVPSAAGV